MQGFFGSEELLDKMLEKNALLLQRRAAKKKTFPKIILWISIKIQLIVLKSEKLLPIKLALFSNASEHLERSK